MTGCYVGTPVSADTDGETDSAEDGDSGNSSPSGDASGASSTAGTSGPTAGDASNSNSDSDSDSDSESGSTGGPPVSGPLLDRLGVVDIDVPAGVKEGVNNWRIWGTGPLHIAPVFTVPLRNCETLVGYTSGSNRAHAVHLDRNDQLVGILDLGDGVELRGLAGEAGAHFGALLWSPGGQQIFVHRFDLSGAELWSTQLVNSDNTPTDFGIGDSRLEWGNDTYGAYYHVHSNTGHEGDTLKWVSGSGAESTEWGWGCSHSMSNLLRWNDAVGSFMPACVTDCYPGTSGDFATQSIGGIYVNHSASKVMDVDAGCNGSVAGELGGAALAPNGWKIAFNAHQAAATLGQNSYNPGTMNQDIGFASIGSGFESSAVVWLTDTGSENEDDASVARWEPGDDDAEQYVVGWHEPNAGAWKLARVDPTGAFLEGPVDVGATARWGRRDDPFRQHQDRDVVWAWFDDPGSTTLHVARLDAGAPRNCEEF